MARVRFPFDLPYPEVNKFPRSLSKKFAEQLTELRCNINDCNCNGGSRTFSQNNPPAIARCGHFVCKTQLDHRKDFDKNARSVSNLKCKLCSMTLDYYMEDKLLEEFFTEIARGGVECASCEGVHPRYNAVRSLPGKGGNTTNFVCVWCAIMNTTYHAYDMELIPPDVYDGVSKILRTNGTEIARAAQSVFPGARNVGWAMRLCGSCGDMDVLDSETTLSLSCGHLIDEFCIGYEDWKDKDCTICKTKTTKKELKEMEAINAKYIGYPKMGELEKCDGGCTLFHPTDNFVDLKGNAPIYIKTRFTTLQKAQRWCVWCVVEKIINKDPEIKE